MEKLHHGSITLSPMIVQKYLKNLVGYSSNPGALSSGKDFTTCSISSLVTGTRSCYCYTKVRQGSSLAILTSIPDNIEAISPMSFFVEISEFLLLCICYCVYT